MRTPYAERVGERIHLTTPYREDPWGWQEQLDATKSVPGARFLATKRVWTYPLDLHSARALRRAFGKPLVLGPELIKWGKAAVKVERELRGVLDMDPRAPAELERVPALAPALHAAMENRGYQTVAAKFGAIAGPHCNFDEQGLGKCIESLGALIESGIEGRGLLVAPRTALSVTWAPEIVKWMDDVPGDVLVTLAHVQELATDATRVREATAEERAATIEQFLEEAPNYRYAFLLVNPAMLSTKRWYKCSQGCGGDDACPNKRNHRVMYDHRFPKLHTTQWDFLMGDEVHLYALHGRQKKPTQMGLGFHKLQAKPIPQSEDGMRIALTGTPSRGRPLNLWANLAWIKPSVYGSRWTFAERYFLSKPNRYTHSGIQFLDELDPAKERELDRELSRVVIRRTSAELRDLNPAWAPPPIRYVEKWVDLTERQADLYQQMVQKAAVELSGRVITADNVLSQLTRLKQFAGAEYDWQDGRMVVVGPGSKMEYVAESLLPRLGITGRTDLDEDGSKVVVASQYVKHLRYWRKYLLGLGIECHILTGSNTDDERVHVQRVFQGQGGPRVFLLQTLTGGVSLTLDAADYGVMMDETWVPDDADQVEKRIHRTSNVEHNVVWYYIRSRETIEGDIAVEGERKRDNDRTVLDGRRGVEWARKHLNVRDGRRSKRSRTTTGRA